MPKDGVSRNCLQKGDVMCRFLFLQNIKERPEYIPPTDGRKLPRIGWGEEDLRLQKKKVQSILTLPRGPAGVPSTDAPGLGV